MSDRRALLLVGSPKGIDRSLSGRLGGRLLDTLAGGGFAVEKLHVHAAVAAPAEFEKALASVAAADLVILAAPLYVDSFPAPVIAFLERIAQDRVGEGRTRFAVLIQCGFPEREQNDTALRIAERFASEAGWTWLGAIALGGLETYGGSVNDALDRAAEALAKSQPVPYVPVRKTMPAWLYRLGGNFMWRRVAKKNGVAGKLRARPYAD